MNEKIIVVKENVKEFYGINNDKCPICDKKFVYITNIVKFNGKGYHEKCFNDIQSK